MGFGDTQVPGPLPPLVNASSQPSSETDLTYIAPPPGPVYPLYVCHDRAPHHSVRNLQWKRAVSRPP